MPTYEYKCESCGDKFDKFQSIKEEPIKVCPKCDGKVKRLISSGAGFIFKGSGFYTTDYRSEGYKKKQKDEKPGESNVGTSKTSTDKSKTAITPNQAPAKEVGAGCPKNSEG